MDIVKKTPQQLTLRLRPWPLWILGAVLSTAGVALVLTMATITTLTCERQDPKPSTCDLATVGLSWSTTTQINLHELQGARIARIPGRRQRPRRLSHRRGNSPDTFQVLLVTTRGEIPWNAVLDSNYTSKEQIVNQIQAFLQQPQTPALIVKDDQRGLVYLVGALLVSMGGGIAIGWGKISIYRFDQPLGQLIIERQGLLDRHTHVYRLSQISEVIVQKCGSKTKSYRVTLVLQSGDLLPLTSHYSSSSQANYQLAGLIQKFLGSAPATTDQGDR